MQRARHRAPTRPTGRRGPEADRRCEMDIETAERAATKLGETILSRKGYEIVDTGSGEFSRVVAIDDGTLVFAKVTVSGPGSDFPSSRPDRKAAERSAMAWLAGHGDLPDMPIRFDVIDVVAVTGCNKGIARHTVSALSEA